MTNMARGRVGTEGRPGEVRAIVCTTFIAVSSMLMLGSTVGADAQALVQYGFEDDADAAAWRSYCPTGKLTIAHDPANVRAGAGALEFSYEPAEQAFFIIETDALDVRGAQSLFFSVKCSEKTPFLFGVGEEDGSSYDGFLCCPANEWLDVQVNLSDLQLRQDSEDENATPDADQVRSLVFFDLSNLPGDVGKALGWKEGPQSMWLDEVAITAEPAPSRSRVETAGGERRVVLDDFESRLAFGLAVGGADFAVLANEAAGHSLRMRYGATPEQWQGFVLGVGHVDLAGLERVMLRSKATQAARLAVVLEERDGTKYQLLLDLKPGGWQEHTLPVADVELDPETIDENDELNGDELRVMILLVDTLNSDMGPGGTVELWLDDLTAVCAAAP